MLCHFRQTGPDEYHNVLTPEDILAETGPLAELIQNYQIRPQQLEMAQSIDEAIQDHQSIILEAGTGTGKTFAYLIPAILSGKKSLFLPAPNIYRINYINVI